ncbi:MAG: hypothetical protein Q4B82_07015 [Alysiella sp.]|uniref:hypothetical protein n=1 Tax=Alysiella sp. TaxID=1872483 RepID=UPI0026DAEB5F|nr:hypothetical protein [Alysiella sp.]MDO4434311.1 hypothetical protein [Alysiella sp.]
MRLFALFFALLLAACHFSGSLNHASQSLVDGVFRMQYYHTQQPEKRLDGGEHARISFGYVHSVQGIEGEKLGVLWQGKIKLPETGTITIQHSDANKLKIDIAGKPIKLQGSGYTDVHLEKGSHDVQVRYEPKWHADNMAVNFLDSRPRAPESVANDVQAAIKNAEVAFAQVRGSMDTSSNNRKDWQWRDAQLFVSATDKPQILVLSARELVNVELKLHDKAEIEAIVALNGVGDISGSDAPVYRVARQIDDDWAPHNCDCSGGVHLHCSGEVGRGFPEIQALNQTLFGKQAAAYYTKAQWYTAEKMQNLYQKTIAEYEQAKAQCGGSQALRFDNAMGKRENQVNPVSGSGSQNGFEGEQSWLSQMGRTLPESGFDAYYFTHKTIGQPVAQENVPHIAINYVSNQFHSIEAEQFAALWAGYLNVNEDTAMSMQYDLSWAQMRVWLNGKKVFEYHYRDNSQPQEGSFDVIVPKGKNRLEVEYINHYHTVGFALHPQPKILVYPDDEAQQLLNNPDYDVVYAKVYESGNRDSSLPIRLPESRKPIVLVLNSHNSVFWQIQPHSGSLKAVIIQDGKGVVSGSHARVWRVKNLPYRKPVWQFYEYSPGSIDAAQFKPNNP